MEVGLIQLLACPARAFHCSTATRAKVVSGEIIPASVRWHRHLGHLIVTARFAVWSLPLNIISGFAPQNGQANKLTGAQLPLLVSVSGVVGVFIYSWCRPRSLSAAVAQFGRSG